MATRIIEGSDAPASPEGEGSSENFSFFGGFYVPSRLEDPTRDDHRMFRLIDRTAILSRGASVLIDVLEQNAASLDSPDGHPFFKPCYRGAVAALVRESLEMLAEEASIVIAERPTLQVAR